jgi:multidrug efflux pump subunit AcrB
MFTRTFDWITRTSIRFRWPVIVLALIALVAGAYAATTLNLELLPKIEFPQTVVVVQWPDGESPEQFLDEVTIELENNLSKVAGVVNVESTTGSSFAFIIVRNEFGLDQERVLGDLEEAVTSSDLPDGAEVQVLNFSLSDLPVVVASVSSSELTLPELKALVSDELQPRLSQISDVSEVAVSGGQELPDETVAQETQPAAQPTREPGRLPLVFREGAAAFGIDIEYAQDVTPEVLAQILVEQEATDEQVLTVLNLLPAEVLPYAPAETLALLPVEYMTTLDPALQAELDDLAVEHGGINQYTIDQARAILQGEGVVEATPTPTLEPTPESTAEPASEPAELPEVEPVDLPESWVAAAAQFGQTIATTADITPEAMGAIAGIAPELLQDLTPEMWRALDPAAAAVALGVAQEDLDPALLAELQAIQLAAAGDEPVPVALPESWVAAASQFGQRLATTADITPDAMELLGGAAPELLADLTPEQILAFPPAVQAAMPESYLAGLDAGLQVTLRIIAIRSAQYQAAQEAAAEPTPTPDPARLPAALIQGAQQFGVELEYAYDITPDFARLIGAAGPQATIFLQLLTPDNLRSLQPEVIALLPADFVDSLDADLRAELDELAADFGGAGQLALEEAHAAEEAAAGAPPLTGPWVEPAADGTPSQFETAADILDNPFTAGAPNPAAAFIGFLPTAPQIEDPAAWIQALTPEIIAYLAENEEGFAAALSAGSLRLMSPESLTFLLENFPEAFDPALAEELRLIAAGEIEAFIPEASITRTDGNPAVIITVYKAGDANTVSVAHDVFDALDAYVAESPELSYALAFEQASFIEDSVSGVAREGGLGALFAIIVILIFLSGTVRGKYKPAWRATLVVGVSIPLSVAVAFLMMKIIPATLGVWIHEAAVSSGSDFLRFVSRLFPTSVTLNIMTLSGLTVAIGRVVDDSIVVLENSYRYIQRSEDNVEAIIAATREVAIAIFTSTITTIAVFMPLGLVGGIIGSFFLPFGLTVTYALMVSFFVAIIVVPAMTVVLIRRQDIPEEKETIMQRWYTRPLVWALAHRGVTMLIASVIFIASLFLLVQLPQSFIPSIGEPTVNVSINLPNGTTMQETDSLVGEFEAGLTEIAGLETFQSEIGSGGGFEAFFGGGGVSQNLANVTITLDDLDELQPVTLEVRHLAETTFGADNTTVSAASQTGFSGFSLILVGESMEQLTPWVDDVKQVLATIDQDGNGEPDIVNISSSIDNAGANGASNIIRVDGRTAIDFSAELETDNTLGVTQAAMEAIAEIEMLPNGVEVTEGFESEQQTQGFADMIKAIGYSVIIVYLIMALSFRSLIHPFTILFSLPFALVGASIALFITNSILGISAMIGLMMLVGVVVTNAIVLLELVQQLRRRGEPAKQALVEGGRTRLRPIWMTALTAVLALLPLAASREAGAVIASELAITVIGGILVSTFLTLVVVPVVYSLFDDVAARFRRKPAV